MRGKFHYNLLLTLLLLASACGVLPVRAAADEVSPSLGLLGEEPQPAISHFPRPISSIAENVSVITADDIVRLNAHTLAEVLQTIPGIQLEQLQTPGSNAMFAIHNNISRHVQVLIDGVPQNFQAADNQVNLGHITAQMIDRVEIVKGAAATSWGQSLGGVINVITKSPDTERPVGGMASASYGEHATSDLRGELSGTIDRFGYYLTGGNIHSDGLVIGNRVNFNHALAKFTYALPIKGNLTLGLDFRDAVYGLEDVPGVPYPDDYHDYAGSRYANAYLAFNYPLADRLSLELTGRLGRQQIFTTLGNLSTPVLYADGTLREDSRAAAMKLFWGDAKTNISAGLEYENRGFKGREPHLQDPIENFDINMDRMGSFLNATWSAGPLTILPGLRYDHTNNFGDSVSYNLGATWQLTDKTLFRSYFGNGYGLPVINNIQVSNGAKRLQKLWTVQAGFETAAIPYLWFKGSYFYSEISRIENYNFDAYPIVTIDQKKQTQQGFELETRTSPLYGFALSGGYTFTEAKDKDTGVILRSDSGQFFPKHELKLGINYDNAPLGLRGAITGNYIDWNMVEGSDAKYGNVIWDLHLTQKLAPKSELSPELFFSLRNIFDNDQYVRSIRPNAPRWVEGGVRFKF